MRSSQAVRNEEVTPVGRPWSFEELSVRSGFRLSISHEELPSINDLSFIILLIFIENLLTHGSLQQIPPFCTSVPTFDLT